MPGVRVGEFLDFVRSLHQEPLSKDELLDLAGLRGLEGRRVDRLSGGQTQRVRFAMAIAGAPSATKPFLEPLLGKLESKTDINK